jgi:hypothetical protein
MGTAIYLALFLAILFFVNGSSIEKHQVKLALVYQNYARSKVYEKAFNETIRNINTGQSISPIRKLSKHYQFVPVDCILPKGKFLPSDVLECLCGVVVKNQASVIIYVTSTEEYDESTASAQYFLHMAVQTGIPIIAWNADNSGLSFSDVKFNF